MHALHSEPQVPSFVARPICDREIVAKRAVVFQARRNKLGLEEGEDDTMQPLPYDSVHETLQELQQKFHSRPDQVQKRAADERARAGLLTKKGSGMQSPQKRAKARFASHRTVAT